MDPDFTFDHAGCHMTLSLHLGSDREARVALECFPPAVLEAYERARADAEREREHERIYAAHVRATYDESRFP